MLLTEAEYANHHLRNWCMRNNVWAVREPKIIHEAAHQMVARFVDADGVSWELRFRYGNVQSYRATILSKR